MRADPPRSLSRFGITPPALAAIAAIVAVGVAMSLVTSLVALSFAARGIEERTIGALVTTIALGSLSATLFVPRLLDFLRASTLIGLALGGAAAIMPLLYFISSPAALFPVGFVYGVFISTAFVISEYAINASTTDERRGFVLGVYATLLSVGFAAGPAIAAIVGIGRVTPFLVGSAIVLCALIPVSHLRDVSPGPRHGAVRSVLALLFVVPTATFGAFCFAVAESSGFAFLGVWGLHLGLALSTAPLLASAMTLGNALLQIPIGMLADRMDRRLVLLACGLVGALGMALALLVRDTLALLLPVLVVWGGATAGLYTVGLAHLAARLPASELAGANGAFLFAYSLGMLVGPAAVGEAMTHRPEIGLPLALAALFALYSALALGRLIYRRSP